MLLMNQKQIGAIVIIIAIFFGIFLAMSKQREDEYIREIMKDNDGSCFLDDGTCLHADRSFITYVIGGTLIGALMILGVYLLVFDKTQKVLAEHQTKVSKALSDVVEKENQKDEFKAFLAGFSDEEQKVLKAIKEQDGILQSTLRYRTEMSKTGLSLILKNLDEKRIIKKKVSGKTNKVFLVKKF